ncbi:MAG: amino acid ABC transporter ATP-binding protein [Desulfovibrionaceae bacterium]|nr:amino acid ABC transporter ATP-binding protein [Desulfovibrionaceae bacterium]
MIETEKPILEALHIGLTVGTKTILDDCSLSLKKGELKVLIGPSGAGKSTLLQCLNVLQCPDTGTIELQGKKIALDNPRALCEYRTKVGMIFQDFKLFDHLTALDNVAIALRKVRGQSAASARARAKEELARVNLSEQIALYPAQLSGGQKQRVAFARALAMDPIILLLDEPTSALDPELVGEVLSVIRALAANGMTMIMATHQMDFIRSISSEIIFMEKGRIVEEGPPETLITDSKSRTSQFYHSLSSI